MNFDRIKQKWGVSSNKQLAIIFIVFAITGSTSALVAKPILNYFGLTKESLDFWYYPIYVIAIFPLYQVLLVSFGFLFGQFKFFWWFEKKMLKSLRLNFIVEFLESRSSNVK